jgi:hypothetical protein
MQIYADQIYLIRMVPEMGAAVFCEWRLQLAGNARQYLAQHDVVFFSLKG